MLPMATGRKQNMVIPGYQITHGVGLRFITAGGIMMIIMDGNGYRATIGHRPGLAGAMVAAIIAGHR